MQGNEVHEEYIFKQESSEAEIGLNYRSKAWER